MFKLQGETALPWPPEKSVELIVGFGSDIVRDKVVFPAAPAITCVIITSAPTVVALNFEEASIMLAIFCAVASFEPPTDHSEPSPKETTVPSVAVNSIESPLTIWLDSITVTVALDCVLATPGSSSPRVAPVDFHA